MSAHPSPRNRRQVLKSATGLAAAGALPISLAPEAAASTSAAPRPSAAGATFSNPVIWQDFADVDIIRVNDTYYLSASTMHYSPGAPVLRSYDLVNWEFAGHSVPVLDFGSKYDLNGGRGYVRGIWASSLNYRPSNKTFYWIGQIDFSKTYIYTATDVEGPWSRHTTIDTAYYDCGLLIDDNDTMYVSYGNTNISVAQLSADGKSQVRSQQVFSTPSSVGTLEGSRFYKINGNYYIFLTRPANGQYILKSTSGPFGPYTMREVLLNMQGPISGGGVPHQGGLVQTQNGDWYYMAFVDAYPGGRMPAMAPITWDSSGWPSVQTVNGAWGTSYPFPNLSARELTPLTGADTFDGTSLKPQWEWNHNPDTGKYSVNDGLTLNTATVTDDLYSARNTLTHRIQGPTSTATIILDYANMSNGDRAGLAVLRDSSAWIGIKHDNGGSRVCMINGITMDSNWNTSNKGSEAAGTSVSGGRIWLRAQADIRPGSSRPVTFSYSTDGNTFTTLGPTFSMGNAWQFFMGHRFAIFNYATQALGGSVEVEQFTLATSGSSSGTVHLVNARSGLLLGVEGMSTADGAMILQWSDNGTADHNWDVINDGDAVKFRNANSGKVLGVQNMSTTDGATILQWSDNGTADHRWTLQDQGNGTCKIRNVNSGKLLGIQNDSTAVGAYAVLDSDDGSSDNQWRIVQSS